MPSGKRSIQGSPPLDRFFWPSLGGASQPLSVMSQTAPQGQPANFHINGQNLYLLPDELIILKELIKAEGKPVTNEWLKGCIFKDYNALRQVFASLKKKLKPCPRLHIGLILARGYALTGVEVFRELPP